ncbi:hypothetical protein JCM10296v2_000364 [Rhodotorula toruloides]
MSTRRTRRSGPPKWENTLSPIEKTRRVRIYQIDFLCIPPSSAPSTSTARPASFTIRVDVNNEISQRLAASGRTNIGPVVAHLFREVQKDFREAAEKVAGALTPGATESDIRQHLAQQGIPVAQVGVAGAQAPPMQLPLPKFTDRVVQSNHPWQYTALRVYWEKTTVDDFGEGAINVSESTLYEQLDEKYAAALERAQDAQNVENWQSMLIQLQEVDEPYFANMLKILFVTIVEAYEAAAAQSVGAVPPVLSTRSRFQELLRDGYAGQHGGESSDTSRHSFADESPLRAVDWFCCYRVIEPQDVKNRDLAVPDGAYVRLDLVRCSHKDGNSETSIIYSRNSYLATGELEDNYEESAMEFVDATVLLSANRDERSFEDAVSEIEGIRSFDKVRRGGVEAGQTRHPKRTPVEWALRRTLFGSTAAGRSSFYDASSFDRNAEVAKILARIVTTEGDRHIVRFDFTGAVIANMSSEQMTAVEYDAYLAKHHNGRSNISLDHEHQVTLRVVLGLDGTKRFIPAFSTPSNFKVCSVRENWVKHRYPPTIFALLLLFYGFQHRHPDWQRSPDQRLHAVVISYISAAIVILYRTWQVPCPWFERLVLPPHIMYAARIEQELAAEASGVDFHKPATSIREAMDWPTDAELEASLAASGRLGVEQHRSEDAVIDPLDDPLTIAFIRRAAHEGYVSAQQLRDALTTVRPEEREKVTVDEKKCDEMRRVGRAFVEEIKTYGLNFKLNDEGIPSLNLAGNDTSADIYRALRAAHRAFTGEKASARYGVPELYIHSLSCQIYAVLGDEVRDLIVKGEMEEEEEVEAENGGRAQEERAEVRPPLRAALSPSTRPSSTSRLCPSRLCVDPSFRNFNPANATFVFDAWSVNTMLRGGRDSHEKQVEEVSDAAWYRASEGAGQSVASTFGVIDGYLDEDKQAYLLTTLYDIIKRNPHIYEDHVVKAAMEGVESLFLETTGTAYERPQGLDAMEVDG